MRIRFGPFTLDFERRQLTNAGEDIHLEPKAFELLSALVLERPKALSKAELQERLWPGTFVAEANLSNLVARFGPPSATRPVLPSSCAPRTASGMRSAVTRSR